MLAVRVMSAAGESEPQSQVTVREERGVYTVSARFFVPQPASIVLDVLTDYEDIPRFMPQIKTSVLLEHEGGRAVVEQVAVSRFMAFSRRVHLVLDIVEGPDALHFRDKCGVSFSRYEGAWRMSEKDGRTEVVYELTTRPSFEVPEFLVKRLLKRDSATTIEQLRREIAARSR